MTQLCIPKTRGDLSYRRWVYLCCNKIELPVSFLKLAQQHLLLLVIRPEACATAALCCCLHISCLCGLAHGRASYIDQTDLALTGFPDLSTRQREVLWAGQIKAPSISPELLAAQFYFAVLCTFMSDVVFCLYGCIIGVGGDVWVRQGDKSCVVCLVALVYSTQ